MGTGEAFQPRSVVGRVREGRVGLKGDDFQRFEGAERAEEFEEASSSTSDQMHHRALPKAAPTNLATVQHLDLGAVEDEFGEVSLAPKDGEEFFGLEDARPKLEVAEERGGRDNAQDVFEGGGEVVGGGIEHLEVYAEAGRWLASCGFMRSDSTARFRSSSVSFPKAMVASRAKGLKTRQSFLYCLRFSAGGRTASSSRMSRRSSLLRLSTARFDAGPT